MRGYEIEKQLTNLLDEEAKRIMDILLDMYKKKTKVNKAFPYLVEDFIQDEFKPYETSIISKTISLIPLNLMMCPTNEWVFVTEREYHQLMEEENINKIKNGMDNNKELVEKISKKIVDDYKSNNLYKKNILEIIYTYIPKKKLLDIDSEVITCMIESIVFNIEETYQVSSINPFVIEGL